MSGAHGRVPVKGCPCDRCARGRVLRNEKKKRLRREGNGWYRNDVQRAAAAARMREVKLRRVTEGVCYRCGSADLYAGGALCVTHVARRLVDSARGRARVKGIPMELTTEWVAAALDAGTCQATGQSFAFSEHGRSWLSPSLDQRNPGEGYTKENTAVVTWSYNRIKHARTAAEFVAWCRKVVELHA